MKRRSKCVIFKDIYEQPYSDLTRMRLTASSKSSLGLIQRLNLLKKLPVHNGCVNSICWNETGEYILSGSDDQHLVVTHGYNYKVLTDYKTSHRANIFSAKFLPNSGDNNIISCSGDGIILYTEHVLQTIVMVTEDADDGLRNMFYTETNLMRKEETYYNQFNCHSGTTYKVITIPNDPHSFLSCGEDGTVRWFDLRVKDKCNKSQCKEDIMITCQRAVTALSVNPIAPYQLAIGCSDSTVRMFDRRMLGTKASGGADSGASLRPLCSFTVPSFEDRSYRITSLTFSPEGEEVLVSYSSDHLYLFSVKDHGSLQLKTATSSSSSSPDTENGKKSHQRSPPPVRRLRLRGDWSDTGPDARPEREGGRRGEVAQARPTLHATLMQRMTDVLSRMLNDPATRAALSGGGEDSLEGEDGAQPAPEAEPQVAEDALAPSSSGSISVPHLSSLSINSSPEAVEPSSAGPSSLPEPTTPEEPSNALDLSQVPQTESAPSLGTSPGSELIHRNISNLKDQLSTMREGFIERHGSEPAVNLMYSEKSSTGATISLGLGDEVSRELHQDEIPNSPLDSGASTSQNTTTMEVDSVPGPSQSSNVEQTNAPPETQLETEDDYNDSDDEVMIMASRSRRFIHPIEEHMDEAIAAARHDKEMMFDEQGSLQPAVKQKYVGHRNARTMIKEATFWGSDYVLSGSDCGHVFIWNRYSGELVMLLEADHHVVNCLQPHPVLPLLATSGIDYDVKLWAPVHHEPNFDTNLAEILTKRNEVMLEETKDTITVPASFMIRMLACLNQIRRGGRGRSRNTRRNPGEDSSSTSN